MIVPVVLAASIALGTYSFRYAAQLSAASEQSLGAPYRLVLDQTIAKLDNVIVDSDRSLFDLVDVEHLADFAKSWSYIVRVSPAIEAAMLLDSDQQLLSPDAYVSKLKGADREKFKSLFMKQILPDLPFSDLK